MDRENIIIFIVFHIFLVTLWRILVVSVDTISANIVIYNIII